MYPAPPVTKTFIGREPSRGERAAQWEKWGQAKSSGEMFDGRRARFCPANRAKPLECSRIPPLLVGQGAWLPIAKHQKSGGIRAYSKRFATSAMPVPMRFLLLEQPKRRILSGARVQCSVFIGFLNQTCLSSRHVFSESGPGVSGPGLSRFSQGRSQTRQRSARSGRLQGITGKTHRPHYQSVRRESQFGVHR